MWLLGFLHQDISINNAMMYKETLPDGTIRVWGLLIDFDYAIKVDELGCTARPGDCVVSWVNQSHILDLTAHINRIHFCSWLLSFSVLLMRLWYSTPLPTISSHSCTSCVGLSHFITVQRVSYAMIQKGWPWRGGTRVMIWPYLQITRRVVCHLPATSTTSLITIPNSIHVLLCYLNSLANNNSTLIVMLTSLSSIKPNTSLDLNNPALPRTQSHHSTIMQWSLFSAAHACIYTMRRSQRRMIMAFSHSTSWKRTIQVWSLLKEPVFVLQWMFST